MSIRNLITIHHIPDLEAWLHQQGYTTLPTKGKYEVLRWKNPEAGEPMCIVFKLKDNEFKLSCNQASAPYILRYLEGTFR